MSGRFKILDDLRDRPFDAEEFLAEKVVLYYFVTRALIDLVHTGSQNHVAYTRVRELRYIRVLSHQFEIVSECAFPGQPLAVAAVSLEEVAQVYFILSHVYLRIDPVR